MISLTLDGHIFSLDPPHLRPGGMHPPPGTLGTPIRAHKQQYLKTNDNLKEFLHDTFFILTRITYKPGGIKFVIWSPRDPFQSPQIAIFNPETIQFSFASFSSEKGQLWLPKMFKWNQFFFGTTSLVARGHVSNTWNPQEPVQSLHKTNDFTWKELVSQSCSSV